MTIEEAVESVYYSTRRFEDCNKLINIFNCVVYTYCKTCFCITYLII